MPRVIRVELDGTPDVDQRLMPQCGELILHPVASCRLLTGTDNGKGVAAAKAEAPLVGKKCRITEQGGLTDWHHEGDGIVWTVCFPLPGRYRVWLQTETWGHSEKWDGSGRRVEVCVGKSRVEGVLKKDRVLPKTVYERMESGLGIVEIPSEGEYEITVRTLEAGGNSHHCDLTALRIVKE